MYALIFVRDFVWVYTCGCEKGGWRETRGGREREGRREGEKERETEGKDDYVHVCVPLS